MKMPSESTIKAVSYAAVALAGVYYLFRFTAFQNAGQQMLKPVAEGISGIFDAVRFAGERVESTQSGVILRLKDFSNGVISQSWYESQSALHPGNPAILQMSFTAGGRLKEPYWSLLQQNGLILIDAGGGVEVAATNAEHIGMEIDR